MKKALIVLALAAAPTLFAADTNTASNALELAPVGLLEQAGLVREIAEDASRGFDAEAHAKWVRGQIEALKSPATDSAPPVSTNAVSPLQPFVSLPNASLIAVPRVGSTTRSPSEELQQVIDRLRLLKQGLETNPKSD